MSHMAILHQLRQRLQCWSNAGPSFRPGRIEIPATRKRFPKGSKARARRGASACRLLQILGSKPREWLRTTLLPRRSESASSSFCYEHILQTALQSMSVTGIQRQPAKKVDTHPLHYSHISCVTGFRVSALNEPSKFLALLNSISKRPETPLISSPGAPAVEVVSLL